MTALKIGSNYQGKLNMSLLGTLAKVAVGYAAARGVDQMGGMQGLAGLFGGAQIPAGEAQTETAPGMGNMQDMIAQMTGGAGLGGLQDMVTKMASQNGFDLSALMGGGAPAPAGEKGGLLSSASEGGAGMAGVLAALGGVAAMNGKGAGALLDQFSTVAPAPQAEEAAGLMLRAMIQAAKADGEIDKAEQAKIMETVGDDADAEDIAFIKAQLAAPVDVKKLAADTPDMQKTQVYSMSLMSIRVDTKGEAQYLDSLAKALGLNQQTVNALHMQMGVQPLYA
jgi:uncharacterized membrane protein YebE (DUF533 family)